jgi:glycosyltransferase involved in cell wall biosynthesis
MRVLLQGRSAASLAQTPGGDQVQIEETARALRQQGVEADVSSEMEPDLAKYDAVHLFGLVRPQEVWVQARNARRQGKPIALSTVYCDVWEFERNARGGAVGLLARHSNRNTIEALKAVGRGVKSREWSKGSAGLLWRGFSTMQRQIVNSATVFLPNSASEWDRVSADLDLSIDDDRVFVVPNGVDLAAVDEARRQIVHPPEHLRPFEGCVLCVARIEGRKNQLALLEALADSAFTVVLAGRFANNQPGYVRRVQALAARSPNVHILGSVSEPEKLWLYSLARVHALPSWIETTGLSTLEAAVFGCALVVTPNGDTRDYFDGYAEFCDPASPRSIRSAVERAYEQGPVASTPLAQKIRTEFTWTAAATATREAYARLTAA